MIDHDDYEVTLALRRHARTGGHYFDTDTMRGFGSKVHAGYAVPDGTLITMSNKDRNGYVLGGARHYYVIRVDADGKIHPESGYSVTRGEGYWLTLRAATRWAMARQQDAVAALS